MASFRRPDVIYSAVEAGTSPGDSVVASWRRSLKDFHIDPETKEAPHILSERELKESRGSLESLVTVARGELDRLYRLMREVGYVVLLTDVNGVAIDHRGNDADAEEFKRRGIWLGGVWSEIIEGTNGIGTCIVEQRPVTVHQAQHFRARHTGLSCSGAPIFCPEGHLLGVLDVSSMDPELSGGAHALSLPVTTDAACAIEERLFRHYFSGCWIMVLSRASGAPFLLAVDGDQRVVGADRQARQVLGLDDTVLRDGIGLWTLFERDPSLFRPMRGDDLLTHLQRIGDHGLWQAVVTWPALRNTRRTGEDALRNRPRATLLLDIPKPSPESPSRGGLSPRTLRRVKDHIEQHLHEPVALKSLAEIAGLSVWHFAREFQKTVDEAPYGYVLQRRVERARHLLKTTDLPLPEIALATGFADHSHLARHFRRRTGVAPNTVRRQANRSPATAIGPAALTKPL